jgi:hypothetical protein
MLPATYRANRIQKTLQRFEGDIPLLNLRVKDLSPERQRSARQFAEALIQQTRAELDRVLAEEREPVTEPDEVPCEPAD